MIQVEKKVFILHACNLAIMNSIITGASRGLGKAIAEQFAAAGYDLVLSSRDPVALDGAVRELGERYPAATIRSRAADLSDKEQAQELGRWVLDTGVPVDVLVNNAGQFIYGSLYEEAEGMLEQLIAVNLYGAYHLTRALLPVMMSRKKGHIFNICSIASLKAYYHGGAYGISKYALAGFSANLREEMKEHGIKVTAVYPGAAYTDSWTGSGVDPHRIMEAGDIARMVVAAAGLSPQATVEEIVLRPQLGDL
jgi:short-subunit dehydrogenase